MSNPNSASHWCKAVIDQAVPAQPITLVPPPAPVFNPNATTQNTQKANLSIHTTAPATMPKFDSQLSPQYVHLYSQLYPQPQQPQQIPVPPTVPATDSTRSYASVVAQPSNPASLSRPISAPWGSYGAPIFPPPPVPVPSPASIAVALQQKKPNPSRFTAVAPPISAGPPGLSSVRSAPPVAAIGHPPPTNGQPESLKRFVVRSFSSCNSNEEREFVTGALKKIIEKVTADGRMHVHDWDREQVPVFDPSKPIHSSTHSRFSAESGTSQIAGTNTSNGFFNPYLSADATKTEKKRKGRFVETEENGGISYSDVSSLGKSSVLAGVEKLNTPQEIKMRQQRASRFQFDEQQQLQAVSSTALESGRNKKNKKNNANAAKIAALMSQNNHTSDASGEFNLDSLKIVGTCQKLEKDYLRLTSAPHPNVVRPEPVLRKTIQLIKQKWSKEEVDYVYMCSQLKSIRQDLTVQHIQNDFTVHVYETHARVALESDDMNEYNQCQTQLKHLYATGLKGNEMEFTAYRVLYYVYLLGNKKYTGGNMDLAHLMKSLSPEAHKHEAVVHALQIRQALQLDNYHKFFKLYLSTPNMGAYILDLMIDNWRVICLQKMCRSYKPEVTAQFVIDELAFTDTALGIDFMRKVGCVLATDKETKQLMWNTKDSVIDPSALQTQAKLLL